MLAFLLTTSLVFCYRSSISASLESSCTIPKPLTLSFRCVRSPDMMLGSPLLDFANIYPTWSDHGLWKNHAIQLDVFTQIHTRPFIASTWLKIIVSGWGSHDCFKRKTSVEVIYERYFLSENNNDSPHALCMALNQQETCLLIGITSIHCELSQSVILGVMWFERIVRVVKKKNGRRQFFGSLKQINARSDNTVFLMEEEHLHSNKYDFLINFSENTISQDFVELLYCNGCC